MRTCLYILAIILVITSISCQYAPQSPVARMPQPQAARPTSPPPEGSSASMPDAITSSQAAAADKYSAQAKEDQNEVSKTITISGKEKPPLNVLIRNAHCRSRTFQIRFDAR